jgi:hypothetical protein
MEEEGCPGPSTGSEKRMKIERGSKNFLTVILFYRDIPRKDSLRFQSSRLVKILTLIIILVERSKPVRATGANPSKVVSHP